MCDGTVAWISIPIYRALSTRAGGETAPLP
jgi:hypothetical protein